MVGDINQLPPVYGKSILGFAMQAWPTYELRTIHRNAGLIIRNANRVLGGNIGLEQVSPLESEDEVFSPCTPYLKGSRSSLFPCLQNPPGSHS